MKVEFIFKLTSAPPNGERINRRHSINIQPLTGVELVRTPTVLAGWRGLPAASQAQPAQ